MYVTYIFLPVPPFLVIKVQGMHKKCMPWQQKCMYIYFHQKKCHFYSFFDTKSIFLLFLSTFVIKLCVSNAGLASLHDKNACILFLIKKSIHAFFFVFLVYESMHKTGRRVEYGMATISRLLKIISLFCRISSLL